MGGEVDILEGRDHLCLPALRSKHKGTCQRQTLEVQIEYPRVGDYQRIEVSSTHIVRGHHQWF